ncbi:MAG: SLC13 family permease, partial [Bdellovibrionales bacterium]|nr:SLC13 family permease [Bdellovibrionales bacterium]
MFGLDMQQLLFILILTVSIILFVTEWVRVDLVSVLIILSLVISGILETSIAFSGFASEPVIIVAAVFVLSAALSATGVTDRIGDFVTKMAGNREWQAILVFMIVVALLSAFTHHLMITAMMLPVVMQYCREKNIYSSRILIPMATAASLGTTMTIISAPAFLLANNILMRSGAKGLHIFDVFPIGISLTALSIIFVILTRWVLPKRFGEQSFENKFQVDKFYTEIEIPKDSKWIGVTFESFYTSTQKRFLIIEWIRNGHAKQIGKTEDTINVGDIFLINASPDEIISMSDDMGLALKPVKKYQSYLDVDHDNTPVLLQAVLAPNSRWVGQNLRATDFLRHYRLIVV